MKTEKTKISRLIHIVFPLIVAVSGAAGCQPGKDSSFRTEALTPVEVSAPGIHDIKKEMVYAGQVTAAESVNVISKVAGKVLELYLDVGDTVSAGDVLFKLDETDINNQIVQLDAQIAQAAQGVKIAENAAASVTGGQYQAQVLQQETSIESYDKQIDNALINLNNAQTTIDNAQTAIDNAALGLSNANKSFGAAKTQFESTQTLFDAGLVTQNDYDRAKLGYEQAEAGVTQAESLLKQANFGYSQAKNTYEQAQISRASLVMARDRAKEGLDITTNEIAGDNTRQASLSAESARASLGILLTQKELVLGTLYDTAVRSPISGVVSARTAKANEYVSNQAPAFVIVNLESVLAEARVSELIINSVKPGDDVSIFFSALGGEEVIGKVSTVSPAADQTGTFPVKIEIPNTKGVLKPGMFAEIRFVWESRESALTLPRSAVLSDETGSYVFTASEDGTAKKTPVETGIDNGDEIEIISGLTNESRVVTKGQSYISDNEKMNITAINTDAVTED